MVINPELFIFVHLQKTGGTFVENFLLENFKECKSFKPKHSGILEAMGLLTTEKSFGVIRNPFDWYVSWWSKNRVSGPTLFPKIFNAKRKEDFGEFLKYALNGGFGIQHDLNGNFIRANNIGILTYRCIYSFFNYMVGIKNIEKDPNNHIMIDTILRTETLNDDLKKFLSEFADSSILDKLNSRPKDHTSNHKRYTEYYEYETIKLVEEKDKFILNNFNYKFGD